MKMNSYSQEIASIVHAFLANNDWRFHFDEDPGIFHCFVGLPTAVKMLDYSILVHDHSFTVSVRYPLGPDPDNEPQMNTMARFLTRANYGLRNGSFEMDLEDGEIRFKVFCNCRGIDVSDELIEESMHCPAAMFKKYEEGLLGILFCSMSDREAIEKCEVLQAGIRSSLKALREELEKELSAKEQNVGAEDDDEQSAEDTIAPQSFAEFLKMLHAASDEESNSNDNENAENED